MKNIVFATAIALGSLSTISAHPPIFHDGIMDVVFAQEFTEISVKDVPTKVKGALEKEYQGAVIKKAYLNDELQYKLEVTLENGSKTILYYDENGNWIDL
ncbi:hypothetical protein [Sediminicola sp. 1XM1-17]|uniref:hypothetical protein n=1 Tax=Sediminicola sp. 1XM1-17 TaxID=3127702 RepID=UPI003076FBEB